MKQCWIREGRGKVVFVLTLILCLALGWILYLDFGHQLVKAMYEGRSIGILNGALQRPVAAPVGHYFDIADKLFLKGSVIYLLITVFITLKFVLIRPVKVAIFFLVFLFLLEFSSRFYLFGFDSFNYFKMNSMADAGVCGFLRPATQPEIIYEIKPNLNSYHKMVHFKTNSQGLVDKEYSVQKPPNVFRVAVLGASATMPAGVANEDAFHSLLEQRLNSESSQGSYEFINFAVPGYTLKQCLASLKYKVLSYDPDLVLLVFPIDWTERAAAKPYAVKPRSYPFFESFFKKLVNNSTIMNRVEESRKWPAIEGRRRERVQALLSEFRSISSDRRIPVGMIFLLENPIQPLAAEDGFPVIDVAARFDYKKFKKEFLIFPFDPHPNAAAHKIFADIIYNDLKKHNLLKAN